MPNIQQWYPAGDYTLEQARSFLTEDFSKSIKRTRYLYLDAPQHETLGPGFFEPLTLGLCWCDFLGGLYVGIGQGHNTKRAESFMKGPLEAVRPGYAAVSRKIVDIYRHGGVHAYAPADVFEVIDRSPRHLSVLPSGAVLLAIEEFLDDLDKATELYALGLTATTGTGPPAHGSLGALNLARRQMQSRATSVPSEPATNTNRSASFASLFSDPVGSTDGDS
jgi:hypothetical protein